MRLNKLEIKGFKSFGDKTVINFNEGVTGIVGPNGCGKSNIVDAIRWVLGEQKTTLLRSDKMENVIFNGSKTRKKLQLAEVSITFDNTKNLIPTEYSNVSVTRKYFRSGDSEYLLNDVKCRLKDITNLFLDTGISSNNYAIIELSMVDNILNNKDNSRLSLFEEAAGISKFKKRKKETINKIRYTDSDLDRVEDLIHEIEKNLRSLKKQSKQSEKFNKYKDEYKKLSINLALKQSEKNRKLLSDQKNKLKIIEDDNIKIITKIGKLNSKLESSKSSLIPHEKKLIKKQKEINDFLNKIRKHEESKRLKAEKSKLLNENITDLKEKIKYDTESNNRSKFSLNSIKKEIKTYTSELNNLIKKLDKTKKEYLKYEKDLKNKSIKISDISDVEDNFRSIQYNLTSLTNKKTQLLSLVCIENVDVDKLIKKIKSLQIEIDELNNGIIKVEHLFKKENKEIIRINKIFTEQSKNLSNEEIVFNKLKNKIESLEKESDYKSLTFKLNNERIEKNIKSLDDTQKEIEMLTNENTTKDSSLIKMYNNKEILENDLEKFENDYYKLKNHIDNDDKELKNFQEKKDNNVLINDELKTSIYNLDLELNSVVQRISVEFDLELKDCKIDNSLFNTNSFEKLKSRQEKLKNKIEKIGQINPLAKEAFDEIKERHDFITKEKNDLIEAKDSLLKTIEEMDKVAKISFVESFNKIKSNFKTVFRSLFTEDDDCDLLIVDENNPLESSIEIMAKPKGKKPLTINQLSGGEKTLTATSLLFAIYLLKPAPFCIFDEVDAPLDDANIDKFNKIINKFSNSSQFIIVTHNKRTMINTDIIYGITMPEQGVSKVVPVDLRNLKN